MLIMSVIISLPAFSQAIYPVQVYTQLTPPYTPYVPAYYTGTQEKLSVTLVNTDMHQPLLNVYLKMKITSSSFSLITPDEVFTPHIELQAGVPLKLSLTDLAVYFKKENLRVSGGQNEFYRTQLLPDNFYRFNFEVYEVNTNKLLSNPKMGFAQTMIASGEPPVLTMPQKGEIVIEKNIPNIFFSWVPRHMNSIAAAYGTEYEFTMVEIYDKRVAPEAAFDYSRVLYTETTKSTTFVHTAAQPMLQPGLRYAWRVRAVAKEGVNEISVFKNGGYSQVYWFDYTKDCKPVYSTGAIYNRDHIKITWIETEASDYTVEYRKKGSSKWYTGNITGNHCSIYNLKLGGEYEYRVGSRCLMNDPYQYSQIKGFRLPAQEERSPNCGLMPDTKLTNRVPARELQKGLPVMVGDFPVFITKVSGSGRFSGEGYVGIPYLQGAQITVTFKDIVVNTDNQLISGYFETKYDTKTNNRLIDIDQTLTGGKGVGDIRTGEEKAAFKVDYTINPHIKAKVTIQDDSQDDISEEDDYTTLKGLNESYKGHIVIEITDDKGKKQKIVADRIPATIEDADGKIYEIDEVGNITLISQISDIKLDDKTKNKQRSDIAALSFRASAKTKYSIDEYKDIYAKVTEYYEKYKLEGTNIEASAKFMLPGTSDEVEVYIKDSKKQFIPDSVRFINSSGKEYTSKYNQESRTWLLTTVGSEADDGQELFAVQRLADGSVATLGKLNIFTYQPLERTLNLVSVNGESNHLTTQSVQEELNKIYGKIGITWKVNFLQSGFTYTPANRSTFNVTGSGLFSTLTNDMKAINEAFKKTNIYQEDGLYLFVLPYEPSDKGESMNASGDMPLGSQFGYLFPSADARTIAHEIGHGAFNLEHPFSRPGRNSFKKGDLQNNLMDYTSGTDFAKIQWDATRAPGLVIGLLQNDKDGMKAIKVLDITDGNKVTPISYDITTDTHFLLPSGDLIHFTDKQIAKIEQIYLDENGFLSAINDGDFTYRHSRGLTDNLNLYYNNRFVSFDRINQDLASKVQENRKRSQGVIINNINIEGEVFLQYSNVPNDYILTTLIKENFVLCVEGLDLLTRKKGDDKYSIIKTTQGICNTSSPCSVTFIDSLEILINEKSGFHARALSEALSITTNCTLERLSGSSRQKLYSMLFQNSAISHPYSSSALPGGYQYDYQNVSKKYGDTGNYLLLGLLETSDEKEQTWFFNEFLYQTNNEKSNLSKLITGEKDVDCIILALQKIVEIAENNPKVILPKDNYETIQIGNESISLRLGDNPIMLYYENWLQSSNSFKIGDDIEVTCDNTNLTLNKENIITVNQNGHITVGGDKIFYKDNYQLHPWQKVRLIVGKDMSNQIAGLEVGKMIEVPAVLAFAYCNLGEKRKTDQNAQISMSAVATLFGGYSVVQGVGAALTIGSITATEAVYLTSSSIVVSTSLYNLYKLSDEDQINLSQQERKELQNWKTFYTYLLTIDGGINLYSSYKGLSILEASPSMSVLSYRYNKLLSEIASKIPNTILKVLPQSTEIRILNTDLKVAIAEFKSDGVYILVSPNNGKITEILYESEELYKDIPTGREGKLIFGRDNQGTVCATIAGEMKTNSLYEVGVDMRKLDIERKFIDEDGLYKTNPTKTTMNDLKIQSSGKVTAKHQLNPASENYTKLHGDYMYVIDKDGNLILGSRAQWSVKEPFVEGKAPHPTLIGGDNPKVQAAGMVYFNDGKILRITNNSGHYKPSADCLKKAEEIFQKNFGQNSFSNKFEGFIPVNP